jgi:hypothetical protein
MDNPVCTGPLNNMVTNGSGTCDGMGNCAQTMSTVCGSNFKCIAGACVTNCLKNNATGDTRCVQGFYCDGTNCVTPQGTGASCNRNSMCTNGCNLTMMTCM